MKKIQDNIHIQAKSVLFAVGSILLGVSQKLIHGWVVTGKP